jgi:exopolysaccharide biosynthesis polyprenyl glycosylphosphotransferase
VTLALAARRLATRMRMWLPWYVFWLVVLDTLALLLGGLFGQLVRFDTLGDRLDGVAYGDVLRAAVPVWILAMATAHCYEERYLGLGSEEFRRVTNAAARFTALFAVAMFMFKWDVARGFVVVALPTASLYALCFRYLARKVLHWLRKDGAASRRVLVVGDGPALEILTSRLEKAPHSGLRVVGTCQPVTVDGTVSSTIRHVWSTVTSRQADTVAVAHCGQITPLVLRELAWSLEGRGVGLLVAPGLTDVAGPRVNIRAVSGLPLIHVAEPGFTGWGQLAKRIFDTVVAGVSLLLASPLLVALALTVRFSSSGPVLFRQVRIGKDGREFVMYKFRSMYADAETRLTELRCLNDHGESVLFKMREDPRVTRVGKVLRRYSLDELPQLVNVVRGQMSLIGPRPPLPGEVARYAHSVHRRLLVKPGLTGLWQVSGRSDLNWEETVRLDLYYVENWSVTLDAEILVRTVWAVLRGSGAR